MVADNDQVLEKYCSVSTPLQKRTERFRRVLSQHNRMPICPSTGRTFMDIYRGVVGSEVDPNALLTFQRQFLLVYLDVEVNIFPACLVYHSAHTGGVPPLNRFKRPPLSTRLGWLGLRLLRIHTSHPLPSPHLLAVCRHTRVPSCLSVQYWEPSTQQLRHRRPIAAFSHRHRHQHPHLCVDISHCMPYPPFVNLRQWAMSFSRPLFTTMGGHPGLRKTFCAFFPLSFPASNDRREQSNCRPSLRSCSTLRQALLPGTTTRPPGCFLPSHPCLPHHHPGSASSSPSLGFQLFCHPSHLTTP